MLKKLKVKYKLFLLIAVLLIGLLTFGGLAMSILSKIRINGAMYQEIVQGKDIVADILPPPEYIIELHLTSYQMLEETDSTKLEELTAYAKTLQDSYYERHEIWMDSLKGGELKTTFLDESYKPVEEYFTIFNEDYTKAILSGDKTKAEEILNQQLVPLYQEHRSAIDKVVVLANEQSALIEKNAEKEIQNGIILFIAVLAAIVVLVIIIGNLILISITSPLNFLKAHLEKIAEGNLKQEIPEHWLKAKDELGSITQAAKTMQDSLRNMIESILEETNRINGVIGNCNENIIQITDSIQEVSSTVEQLSAGVEETAATTEEISAISEKIREEMQGITGQARTGESCAKEIYVRAIALKESSINLEREAEATSNDIEMAMENALEQIKAVEKIKLLTDSILEISNETDLLSLNAAIESARAGETGKGFAIVAEQIRKLAEDSQKAVEEIQNTVIVITQAVNNLTEISKKTLQYIETKVMDSYKESVQVGKNYEKDSNYINGFANEISEVSNELLVSIKSVADALEGIATASNQGAAGTLTVAEQISNIKERAESVQEETENLSESAKNLNHLVMCFRI